jgi:hypothetical protein
VRDRQLAPEVHPWPIDNRLKARQERSPVDWLPGSLPMQRLEPEGEALRRG